jgi:hypothetical protein
MRARCAQVPAHAVLQMLQAEAEGEIGRLSSELQQLQVRPTTRDTVRAVERDACEKAVRDALCRCRARTRGRRGSR